MIQADITPSIADRVRSIFNRTPTLQQEFRPLTRGEKEELTLLAKRAHALIANQAGLTDGQFALLARAQLLAPLEHLVGDAGARLDPIERDSLSDTLIELEATIGSFEEGLVGREYMSEGLEDIAADLHHVQLTGFRARVQL